MKKVIIISAVVVALSYIPYNGFTQRTDRAVDIEQIDGYDQLLLTLNHEELDSKSIVIQVGDQNSAFIKQVGLHTANIQQVGILNTSNLVQSGFGGQFTLYQYGELNQYNGELNGSNIEVLITQNGSLNTINQQVSGDHLLSEMVQEGRQNSISHISNSLRAPNLKIQQRGNNMQLIIKSN